MCYNAALFCLFFMLKLDTNIISRRVKEGELVPENFLDPSKVATSISDPTSTFLEFVSLYYSLFKDIQPIVENTGMKVLSLLPGGFSPKEQTAACILNRDIAGSVDSMTSLDADVPTLEHLRLLFRNRLGKASFLDHLVKGDAASLPFLDESFHLGVMNHGIDDILTSRALGQLPGLEFEYHPPRTRQSIHAAVCRQVGIRIQKDLIGGSASVVGIVKGVMDKLLEGGAFCITNYPSHHFSTYDRIPAGTGYFNDITQATDKCFDDVLEWATTSPDVSVLQCEVDPFSLGFHFDGQEQRFTSRNIALIQKS